MSELEKLINAGLELPRNAILHEVALAARTELTELRREVERLRVENGKLITEVHGKYGVKHLTDQLLTLTAERDKLAKVCGEMVGNGAWPFRDVLTMLTQAVSHLQHNHDCDCHGHENFWRALELAPQYLDRLDTLLATLSEGER